MSSCPPGLTEPRASRWAPPGWAPSAAGGPEETYKHTGFSFSSVQRSVSPSDTHLLLTGIIRSLRSPLDRSSIRSDTAVDTNGPLAAGLNTGNGCLCLQTRRTHRNLRTTAVLTRWAAEDERVKPLEFTLLVVSAAPVLFFTTKLVKESMKTFSSLLTLLIGLFLFVQRFVSEIFHFRHFSSLEINISFKPFGFYFLGISVFVSLQ